MLGSTKNVLLTIQVISNGLIVIIFRFLYVLKLIIYSDLRTCMVPRIPVTGKQQWKQLVNCLKEAVVSFIDM